MKLKAHKRKRYALIAARCTARKIESLPRIFQSMADAAARASKMLSVVFLFDLEFLKKSGGLA